MLTSVLLVFRYAELLCQLYYKVEILFKCEFRATVETKYGMLENMNK